MFYIDVELKNNEYKEVEYYEDAETIIEGVVFKHIPKPCIEDLQDSDFVNNEFNLDAWTERTGIKTVKIQILKEQLQKYKEDVEQVDLFGMQRADYQEKKQLCADIVLELRELEGK